ncbi:SLC13 family permease [Thiolapillus sp.]
MQAVLVEFVLKEWLLVFSAAGFLLTSFFAGVLPSYSAAELEVLFILCTLFLAVKGLEGCGLITRFSLALERGRAIPLKLVAGTFFLSMVVTNDVALILVVPLTLLLNIDRKGMLVILEALAANAGSALTPFGNPQNLFIYWFYDLHPLEFISTIAPFSVFFLILLGAVSFAVKVKSEGRPAASEKLVLSKACIYSMLLVIVLLTVLHVLPVMAGALVVVYVLLFDRKTLRIDYGLLLSFFFFFGLANNLKMLLASELVNPEHVFLFSALASQVMSNVPAALLFAKFTQNWDALLWGTNVGGFGSLFGSLANLIAYKLYVADENTRDALRFTFRFLAMGYAAFFLSAGLYVALRASSWG